MTAPDTIVVFVGPTIGHDAVRRGLATTGAEIRIEPPASRGDLLRLATSGIGVVAVIDGFFESVPSIGHKEILWAIEQGIAVYGSSSMGAIRAAECGAFGMVGVGTIYEAFAAGSLDDDDVVLAHSTSDGGYAALSEAMVNVRATLTAAVADGALDMVTAATLERAAKGRFYADRRWPTIVSDAGAQGVADDALERFAAWRQRHGSVDQKRADAEALLVRISTDVASGARPAHVSHRTTITSHFVRMRHEARSVESSAHGLWRQPVLEELQVWPVLYADIEREAVQRRYARELAVGAGGRLEPASVDAASDRLRVRLGLHEPAEVARWLEEQGLADDDYTAMTHREALAHLGRAILPPLDPDDLMDVIRLRGLTATLRARAEAKAQTLRDAGAEETGYAPDDGSAGDALGWFCRARLGREAPEGPALDALAARLGFSDADALRVAAMRERRAVDLGVELPPPG